MSETAIVLICFFCLMAAAFFGFIGYCIWETRASIAVIREYNAALAQKGEKDERL